MLRYVPAQMPGTPRPLFVLIHGCSGSARHMARAGFARMADRYKLYLLFPEQREENMEIVCWHWWRDRGRNRGEARSIANMVARMLRDYPGIDRQRIFVAGFSSGAFMSALMGLAYPDIFAGVAQVGGGPYGCMQKDHRGRRDYFACSIHPVDYTPERWREIVLSESGAPDARRRRKWPRLSVWHGAVDRNVTSHNVDEVVQQWVALHRIAPVVRRRRMLAPDVWHTSYGRSGHQPAIETYRFTNMGHAIPVRPGSCGDSDRWYSPQPACFAEGIVRFFLGR